MPPADTQRWLASYGRRRGRKLNDYKEELIDLLLPQLEISLDVEEDGVSPLEKLAAEHPRIWVEIGFGGGEHLAAQAEAHPDILFIGCEPYIDGVASLLQEIEERGLKNVRILPDDARPLLEYLPDGSVERMFILFADPWPKRRHHKRRIVSQPMLKLLARVIKPGGELRLATDHAGYGAWQLEHVLANGQFEWQAKRASDWNAPPNDWVPTRYEQKARSEGRHPVHYRFLRKKTIR